MKLDDKTKELIAVGASITAGCQFCLEYHTGKAKQYGATDDEIMGAIAIAKLVRAGSATEMDGFVGKFAELAKPGGEVNIPDSRGCDCGGACC